MSADYYDIKCIHVYTWFFLTESDKGLHADWSQCEGILTDIFLKNPP
jgi:hypothetical protein